MNNQSIDRIKALALAFSNYRTDIYSFLEMPLWKSQLYGSQGKPKAVTLPRTDPEYCKSLLENLTKSRKHKSGTRPKVNL